MAALVRQFYTKPIPADAVRVTHKNKPAVRTIGPDGKPIIAPLTKDGKRCRVPSAKWYGQFTDADGVIQRVPLSTNKAASQQMLNELVKNAELVRAGVRNEFTASASTPLTELLTEYRQHSADAGNCPKQYEQSVRRCESVFEGCGFFALAHLNPETANRWLAERRALPRNNGGFGIQTSNHYIASLKAFGNWCVRTRRLPTNPFQHLRKLNVELDVRHQRRDLLPDELNRLLSATTTGRSFRGLSGADRWMLYLVACFTGLRASELASLTPTSFRLDAETPTVTVAAAYSKHRREDVVPLHPNLVGELRAWFSGKPLNVLLWPGKWASQCSAASMIRKDIDKARSSWIGEALSEDERASRERSDFLRYRNVAGEVIDFHSLRHTFITRLVQAGVLPKDAKELARHSTITLTMDRYSHVGIQDTAAAVGKLAFSGSAPVPLTLPLTLTPDNERVETRTIGEVLAEIPNPLSVPEVLAVRTFEDDQGVLKAEREGFEPSLPLQVNQFSRLTHSTALPPLRQAV